MIGVAVRSTEQEIAAEFFELFKTPWEFYRPGRQYDVVICTRDECCGVIAKLVLFYNAERLPLDVENRIAVKPFTSKVVLSYDGCHLPIYGKAAAFSVNQFYLIKEEASQAPMAFLSSSSQSEVLRIGYDLFQEVRLLLTSGQPAANAAIATLELHIALLRDLIIRSGLPLVEIPPVPAGYNLMVCLTHDLDHPKLRNHCFDHTMFGFLYRATLVSLVNTYRGRSTVENLCQNLAAAGKLPFVYLGMAKDPWYDFDRYLEVEKELGSTYFIIPKRDYAGQYINGSGMARRASRYTVDEINPQLQKIMSAGCEVALHGLDAWLDSAKGVKEQEELSRVTGVTKSGVRMHWLYFDEKSHSVLDQAGFSYDSTFGYNETVGYRAGTAQAYKPFGSAKLLELPLLVMDTALFYPGYLDLNNDEAQQIVWRMINDTEQFGGALTINWHDRSIAPERLWDKFYIKLLNELKRRGAWFPTAAQAVSWFRKRRSAVFDSVDEENGVVKFSVSANADLRLPGLKIRLHKPKARSLCEGVLADSSTQFVDMDFTTNLEASVALSA